MEWAETAAYRPSFSIPDLHCCEVMHFAYLYMHWQAASSPAQRAAA